MIKSKTRITGVDRPRQTEFLSSFYTARASTSFPFFPPDPIFSSPSPLSLSLSPPLSSLSSPRSPTPFPSPLFSLPLSRWGECTVLKMVLMLVAGKGEGKYSAMCVNQQDAVFLDLGILCLWLGLQRVHFRSEIYIFFTRFFWGGGLLLFKTRCRFTALS